MSQNTFRDHHQISLLGLSDFDRKLSNIPLKFSERHSFSDGSRGIEVIRS